MTSIQDTFQADIAAIIGQVGDAHKDLVEALVKDTRLLTMQALNGEDVTAELAQIKLQAMNLGAAKAQQVSDGIVIAMGKVMQSVVRSAVLL